MSEYINNVAKRKETLKNVLRSLHEGKSIHEVKAEFGRLAREASSAEIAEVEQMLIEEGLPATEIQKLCDVHVAVFREGLDEQPSPEMTPGHPVHTFLSENQIILRFIAEIQKTIEQYSQQSSPKLLQTLAYQVQNLSMIDKHYLRKENLLFPYLEKYGFMGPSTVMWGIHDEIRAALKTLLNLLSSVQDGFEHRIVESWQAVSTAIRDMVYKEEKILFPASLDRLKEEDWLAIQSQENEIGYFFFVPNYTWKPQSSQQPDASGKSSPLQTYPKVDDTGLLALDTGSLTLDQINRMLRNLPVDVTFVDENDTVRYFSQTRERIFDRTPAIIGRKVQNCHPPQSVHHVQQILDDFRAGFRDSAEFWIQFRDQFIHIRYFAMRDENHAYRGTLEVTQDITHIRQLEGERRLLDEKQPA